MADSPPLERDASLAMNLDPSQLGGSIDVSSIMQDFDPTRLNVSGFYGEVIQRSTELRREQAQRVAEEFGAHVGREVRAQMEEISQAATAATARAEQLLVAETESAFQQVRSVCQEMGDEQSRRFNEVLDGYR